MKQTVPKARAKSTAAISATAASNKPPSTKDLSIPIAIPSSPALASEVETAVEILTSGAPGLSAKDVTAAIKRVYKEDALWKALDQVPPEGCGPFDGGCLICAKAIILAAGSGELVRITRNGQAQHYGAKVDGMIFDFDGPARTETAWMKRFAKNEFLPLQELKFTTGHDPDAATETPDIMELSQAIALMLNPNAVVK